MNPTTDKAVAAAKLEMVEADLARAEALLLETWLRWGYGQHAYPGLCGRLSAYLRGRGLIDADGKSVQKGAKP